MRFAEEYFPNISQALLARERAARMALQKPLNQFAYKKHHNKKHHLNLASHKKGLGKRALKQEPEVSPEAEGVRALSFLLQSSFSQI